MRGSAAGSGGTGEPAKVKRPSKRFAITRPEMGPRGGPGSNTAKSGSANWLRCSAKGMIGFRTIPLTRNIRDLICKKSEIGHFARTVRHIGWLNVLQDGISAGPAVQMFPFDAIRIGCYPGAHLIGRVSANGVVHSIASQGCKSR